MDTFETNNNAPWKLDKSVLISIILFIFYFTIHTCKDAGNEM